MNKEISPIATVIEGHKNVESRRILQLRIERSSETGLRISMQSPLDWIQFARGKDAVFCLGGVECYRPKQERLNIGGGGYFLEGATDWSVDDFPNLAMLLAKEIQTGVVFNFGLIAVSDERLKEWASNLKNQVKILYLTYMKSFDIEVNITFATIERELHQ